MGQRRSSKKHAPSEFSFKNLLHGYELAVKLDSGDTISADVVISATGVRSNIQFLEGEAVFIDTLSFEKYTEGQAWPAYRQFCQHFLAPLARRRDPSPNHPRDII